LALLAMTLLGAALLWPASSHAFVACTFSGTELTVNMTADDDSVTFQRFGGQIAVLTGSSLDEYSDYSGETQILIPCAGGTPTVTNTDHVSVLQSPTADFGTVTIDQTAGTFAPGATAEADGTSEIEFGLNLPGRRTDVEIGGTDAPEVFQMGMLPSGAPGVNMNAGSDPGDPQIEAPGARELVVFAQGGDDTVTAMGGPGFAGPLRGAFGSAEGGPGNDVLQAGTEGSGLAGDEGRDRLLGSHQKDFLEGGLGKDLISAGGDDDTIYSLDGKKDHVVCGSGKRDRVSADVRDRLKGCEIARRVRLPRHRRPVTGVPLAARFR
jgi:hypothetical protein